MKIIIVEDQGLVRGALTSLLSLEEGIEVVSQAENGEQALSFLQDNEVDIVLTDIEMPVMGGLDLAREVASLYPNVNVIIMTTFSKSGYVKRALQLGVKAFVLKEAPTDYLVDCINKVKRGERVVDPQLALMALDDNDPLSDKERKVLKLAADGLKTSQIAEAVFLSEGTVRNYLSEAISKLNAVNRVDAARIAHQKGWI